MVIYLLDEHPLSKRERERESEKSVTAYKKRSLCVGGRRAEISFR